MLSSLAAFGMVAAAFVVLLVGVPFNRWTFSHHGHRIEILNYGLTETIRVDGRVASGTRRAGDYLSYAVHRLSSPQLLVEVSATSIGMRCVARCGGRTVFDSLGEPADPPPDDPRWIAAETLLAELDVDPGAARPAATLRRVLRDRFEALGRVSRLADAHRTLGGDGMRDVVQRHERRLAEALALVRELHLAAHLRQGPPRPAQTAERSTPRTSTMRSAERAQVDKASSTVTGSA